MASNSWVRTTAGEGVLCRISVATLARVYRRVRDNAQALARGEAKQDAALRAIETDLRKLFSDAKAHSAGVPLSDDEFKKFGLSRLPDWARD
jgi:hypothetical protein